MKSGPQNTGNEATGVFSYNFQASILYAIGGKIWLININNYSVNIENIFLSIVGASVKEESDLKYLYESHEHFSTLPSYAILPSLMVTMTSNLVTEAIPGKEFDLSQVCNVK